MSGEECQDFGRELDRFSRKQWYWSEEGSMQEYMYQAAAKFVLNGGRQVSKLKTDLEKHYTANAGRFGLPKFALTETSLTLFLQRMSLCYRNEETDSRFFIASSGKDCRFMVQQGGDDQLYLLDIQPEQENQYAGAIPIPAEFQEEAQTCSVGANCHFDVLGDHEFEQQVKFW